MNIFSKNLKGHIKKRSVSETMLIWLINTFYPNISIIKDVNIYSKGNKTILEGKNLLPIHDVSIDVHTINLDTKAFKVRVK